MINSELIHRQITQIQQGGIKVVKRKLLSAAKIIIIKLARNSFSTYMLITFLEQVISSFPKSQWAYKQILRSIQSQFAYDSNPAQSAKKFLEYFLPYLELNPESILEWRLTAYHSYWLLQDRVGLQKMMQTYMDTQKDLAKKEQIAFLNFRMANNIFLANYSTHAYLDTHLKAMFLGWQPKTRIVAFIDSDRLKDVCNPTMFEYWQKYIDVISDPKGIELLSSFEPYLLDDLTITANLNGRGTYIEYAKCIVQKEWEKQNREPLLKLEPDDIEHGREMMLTLGLPKDAWFVSLHVRDAGYKTGSHLNADKYDGYRNADIDTYYEAIDTIIRRGGYVVRVGDPKMKPIQPMKGLIDYACSEIRSNRLDIFLFSQCRFFLGTSSGPILTPFLFGTPVVGTNYAPLTGRLHSGNSLVIHKLIWDHQKNCYLSFQNALSSEIGRGFTSHAYESANLTLVDNTPEDIAEVTLEMMDSLDGSLQYSDEDERLQDKINSMYDELSGYANLGRIGRSFLAKVDRQGLLS